MKFATKLVRHYSPHLRHVRHVATLPRKLQIQISSYCCAFSALTLLVGHQEERPACKTASLNVGTFL